jgi:hypothetical protein
MHEVESMVKAKHPKIPNQISNTRMYTHTYINQRVLLDLFLSENSNEAYNFELEFLTLYPFVFRSQICLGMGMGRGSDAESIGEEQEPVGKPKAPKCLKMRPDPMERIKAQPLRQVRSAIDQNVQEDQLQPETKSEVI